MVGRHAYLARRMVCRRASVDSLLQSFSKFSWGQVINRLTDWRNAVHRTMPKQRLTLEHKRPKMQLRSHSQNAKCELFVGRVRPT